ncbi:hypothetical protein RND81_02G064800 [Saponaria officinalis]|uniref:Uncharacterized protein n=1 Tax=Saponaria officinalis TaxID=3572 RepID=A0AAW1MSF4_SAPOF
MNSRVALFMFLIFTILACHECRVNHDMTNKAEGTKIGINYGACIERSPCDTSLCYCCLDQSNCYANMALCQAFC